MVNNLYELRSSLGISQAHLARLLQVSRSTIAMLETGKMAPRGMSEVYLFQAERLVVIAESLLENQQYVLPEPSVDKVSAKKREIEISLVRKQHQLADVEKQHQKIKLLRAFIPLLRSADQFETRKLDALVSLWERNIISGESKFGLQAIADIKLEIKLLQAQMEILN